MFMCFIEININKILPVLLLKLANNLTFVRQPFFNELVIITKIILMSILCSVLNTYIVISHNF